MLSEKERIELEAEADALEAKARGIRERLRLVSPDDFRLAGEDGGARPPRSRTRSPVGVKPPKQPVSDTAAAKADQALARAGFRVG